MEAKVLIQTSGQHGSFATKCVGTMHAATKIRPTATTTSAPFSCHSATGKQFSCNEATPVGSLKIGRVFPRKFS